MTILMLAGLSLAVGFICYETGEEAGWNQGVEDTIKIMNSKEVQTND